MDVDEAFAALPEVYAQALRLHAEGLEPGEIAARLGVPLAAIDSLLRLAAAKLARLRREP